MGIALVIRISLEPAARLPRPRPISPVDLAGRHAALRKPRWRFAIEVISKSAALIMGRLWA